MSKIKDAAIKALAKDIPLHLVGQRIVQIATLTEGDALRMYGAATDRKFQ